MAKCTDLMEKRKKARDYCVRLLQNIKKEKRAMTAEERQKYERADATVKAATDQIELEKRNAAQEFAKKRGKRPGSESLESRKNAPSRDELQVQALRGWILKNNFREVPKECVQAARSLGVSLGAREFRFKMFSNNELRDYEKRALNKGTTTAGGFTVPTGFMPTLEKALKDFNSVRSAPGVTIMRTDTGESLPMPNANDTGNKGELVAEAGSIGSSVDPGFTQTTLAAYKMSSKLVQVSYELLEDNAVNLETELGLMLGERIGRIEEEYDTTGSGTSQPQGIVTASTQGKETAASGVFTAEDLLDLQYSVDRAYRRDPSCAYMFNDQVIKAVRQLLDANDLPIWQPSIMEGEPDRLYGYPVLSNANMSATYEDGDKFGIFGVMSKVILRDVREIRFRRLEELYAANDQVGFIAFHRHDCRIRNAGTNPIKHIASAAA